MNTMNLETVKMTYESYISALEKFHNRGFTDLSRTGGGYTHYLGESFESCYHGKIEEADRCDFSISSLFDYGKPKLIEPSYWLYRSDFAHITFYADEKYKTYYKEPAWVSEDGTRKEAEIKCNEHNLYIKFKNISIGIKYWQEKKKELYEMSKRCKANVAEEILKGIENGDKELQKWRSAKEKMLKVEI